MAKMVPPPPPETTLLTAAPQIDDNPFLSDYAPAPTAADNPFLMDYQPMPAEVIQAPALLTGAPAAAQQTQSAAPIKRVQPKKGHGPQKELVPPPPPSPVDSAIADMLNALNAGAGNILTGMQNAPGRLGDMGKAIVSQGKQRAAEEQKFDLGTKLAATGIGLAHGPLQFGQDAYNAIIGQLGHGSIQGQRFDAPTARFADQFLELPGIRQIAGQLPATTGVASAGANMAVPAGPTLATKGAIPQALMGAGLGGGWSYAGDAGQQLAATGTVDQGAALQSAALGAGIGAGLPLLGAGVGKAAGKLGSLKKQQPAAPLSGNVVENKIDVPGIGQVEPEHALAIAQDSGTAPAVRDQILEALSQVETAQADPGYVNPFSALGREKGLALTQDGKESVLLRTAKQEMKSAVEPGQVDQAYTDALNWVNKNLKGKAQVPYKDALNVLREAEVARANRDAFQRRSAQPAPQQQPAQQPPAQPQQPAAAAPAAPAQPSQLAQELAQGLPPAQNIADWMNETGNWQTRKYPNAFDPILMGHKASGNKKNATDTRVNDGNMDTTHAQQLSNKELEDYIEVLEHDSLGRRKDSAAVKENQRVIEVIRQEKARRAEVLQRGERKDWPDDEPDLNAPPTPEEQAVGQKIDDAYEAQKARDNAPIPKKENPLKSASDDELDTIMRTGEENNARNAAFELAQRYGLDPQQTWKDAIRARMAPPPVTAPEPVIEQPPVVETIAATKGDMPQPDTPAPAAIEPDKMPDIPAEGPRFVVTKDGAYHNVVDSTTGEVKSRSKDRKQSERSAERYNSGAVTNNRGKRTDRVAPVVESPAADKPRPTQTNYQREALETGQPLPEGSPMQERLGQVAELKKKLDVADARLKRALEEVGELVNLPGKINAGRRFSKQWQELLDKSLKSNELGAQDFTIEINSDRRPQVEPMFEGQRKATPEMIATIENLIAQRDALDAEYRAAREGVKEEFLTASGQPDHPSSVNIPTSDGGQVNIRIAANSKKSYALGEGAAKGEATPEYAPPKPDKVINAVQRFLADESGSAPTGGGLNPIIDAIMDFYRPGPYSHATLPGAPQMAKAIAQGAQQSSSIKDLVSDAKTLNPMLHLRRTFDIVQDYDPALFSKLWRNVALEAVRGREISFKPGDEAWIRESLSMDPNDIKLGANGLASKFDAKQRLYLSERRAARKASAALVQNALEQIKAAQGVKPRETWDLGTKTTFETLEQLHDGLVGAKKTIGTNELGLNLLHDALYDYIFKWNPAYHGLNLFDPLVVGSSRAGLQNIVRAKALLNPVSGKKAVKEYVKSVAGKLEGPIDQYRKESKETYFEPIQPTDSTYRKGLKLAGRGLAKIHQLPDLPSVAWNNQDVIAAGLIQHGDDIGYAGGGVKFLEDMSAGKLKLDQEVEAMVHALQVNQDVNGIGSFGLDKDIIGRSGPWARIFQFVSQPLRVTRLVSKWAQGGARGAAKIALFMAIQQQVAGRAAIPRDIRAAWEAADPESIYAVEDFLDRWSALKALRVRDMTDKMEWALIPLLGGIQINVGIGKIADIAEKAANSKRRDAAWNEAGLLVASMVLGGGGGTMAKVQSATKNVNEGERKHYAFGNPFLSLLNQNARPLATKVEKDYDLGKAVSDRFLPGSRVEIGEFAKDARRKEGRLRIKLKEKKR
jgi:hypothetical protein